MWCGAPPESAFLAPCCLFAGAIVAWAITALGALMYRASQRDDSVAQEDALVIGFIACILVVVLHVAPAAVAAALAAAMAAHAALIAMLVLTDSARPARAGSPAQRR